MSRHDAGQPRKNYISDIQYHIPSPRCKMIDVDGVFRCDQCFEPYLMIEEECSLTNDIRDKIATLMVRLCERVRGGQEFAGVSTRCMAYVIQARIKGKLAGEDDGELIYEDEFILMQRCPEVKEPKTKNRAQLEDFFMLHRDNHEQYCPRPTGMHWDRVLRRDVQNALTQAKKASS